MRPLAELNLSNVKPAPTLKEIGDFEMRFKVSLPDSYREFLSGGNGGYPELDTFRDTSDEEWAVNNFFFIGLPDDDTDSLVWNYVNRWSEILPEFVPIARDGFDNLFLLRCRNKNDGQVWIWVHDQPDNQLKQLAPNFEVFIDRLQSNSAYF